MGSLWDADEILPRCQFGAADIVDFQGAYADALEAGSDLPSFNQNTNCILGDNYKPRVAIGVGFSWQSPFGPFRIDLTKPLKTQFGDRTQSLQFNIGTVF